MLIDKINSNNNIRKDFNNSSPNFVRLKSSLDKEALLDRLQYNPEIVEFHIKDDEINNVYLITERVKWIQSLGITVYLHHPSKAPGNANYHDILDNSQKESYLHNVVTMSNICFKYDVKCVVHAHYSGTDSSDYTSLEKTLEMSEAISNVLNICGEHILWEDTIRGIFSYENPYLVEHLIKPLHLNLCNDLSHTFIALRGDKDKFLKTICEIKDYVKYYHVVDSMGLIHDGLTLGEGIIPWKETKEVIANKPFIFEIGLKPPHLDGTPMIISSEYYKKL